MKIFSDYINYFESDECLKRCLLITETNFYILNPNENFKVQVEVKLKHIFKIQISEQENNILVFNI
jgi:hypothetical protein